MNLSRRHFFFGSLALPALAAKKPLGEQPNILLVLVDGLPSWLLGCYGNKEIRTPKIDQLAQTGTRFLNHYAAAPLADPARASLLSGRTPMQLKASGDVTLEKLLGGIGYACGNEEYSQRQPVIGHPHAAYLEADVLLNQRRDQQWHEEDPENGQRIRKVHRPNQL